MKKLILMIAMLAVFVPVSFGGDSTTMFLTLGDVSATPPANGTCDGTMLWLKLTPNSYTGSLGGMTGANTICDTAYPGYHFCDYGTEILPAARKGCIPSNTQFVSPGSGGKVHYVAGGSNGCGNWTSILGDCALFDGGSSTTSFWTVIPKGTFCATSHPLWCCK